MDKLTAMTEQVRDFCDARDWRKYIPLPDSPLKNEVASLVEEINNYLVRYFRGQFLVSIIDGALIGTALLILGLNFKNIFNNEQQ